ncbi:hypothetical protein ACIRU3_44155 [Streptomyces sp. NPDC101151]|uniref:hypothetical protein n=1 Tax=Streptomyces sp. NPDC101151 TaxID=3366115 RepID=UPI0037FAC243
MISTRHPAALTDPGGVDQGLLGGQPERRERDGRDVVEALRLGHEDASRAGGVLGVGVGTAESVLAGGTHAVVDHDLHAIHLPPPSTTPPMAEKLLTDGNAP